MFPVRQFGNCPQLLEHEELGDSGGGVGPRGAQQGVGGMVWDVIVLERCVSEGVLPVCFGEAIVV